MGNPARNPLNNILRLSEAERRKKIQDYEDSIVQKRKDKRTKKENEFISFCEKVNSSKHGFWFELLGNNRQWQLFNLWKSAAHDLKEKRQTPSLRKFIFRYRQNKHWYISPERLRESALNKILNK